MFTSVPACDVGAIPHTFVEIQTAKFDEKDKDNNT